MMEGEQDYVYTDSIKDLQKRLETMFNNAAYADTLFTVQQNKFHALSQLVAVASGKLDAIMSEHFAICDDRDIKLYDVKCVESFTVIMKYVYGLDINFNQLKINVLCEAINLAEVYQLNKFSNDLKEFLSKVNKFQLDSLAVLLNTSRKYNLNELYDKLKVFAFEHAEDFVKHESIVNLQYEVLLNLVNSNWFCAPEIDILMGVLNWHRGMSTKETKKTLDNNVETETNVQNEDINGDASSVGSYHSAASTVLLSNDKDNTEEENQDVDYEGVIVESESADDHNTNSGAVMSNRDTLSVLVKSFTENVLKSLLPHIRMKQITMFDLIMLSETNLFQKYKHILGDKHLFSETTEPRQKYGTVGETKNELISITSHVSDSNKPDAASTVATVTPGPSNLNDEPMEASNNTPLPVDELDEELDNEEVVAIAPDNNLFEFNNIKRIIEVDTIHVSDYTNTEKQIMGSFVIGDLQFSISIANFGFYKNNPHIRCTRVYLQCEGHERSGTWNCNAQCQVRYVAPVGCKYSDRFSHLTYFEYNSKCYNPKQVGKFYWDLTQEAYHQLMSQETMKIEIYFKTLQINWT